MERVSDKDLEFITFQLGKAVNNVYRVSKYCSYGVPVVVRSFPIKDGKPFPTLHYLTCPHLVKEVSKLEEKGLIKDFEKKLLSDEQFYFSMVEAHKKVIEIRLSLLETNKTKIPERWVEVLRNVGTGGIRDFKTVKCLHLHLADYLAGIENPVGKEVYELIKEKECSDYHCSKALSTLGGISGGKGK